MKYFILALKNYFVIEGRSNRKEYWMFTLVYILGSFLLGIISGISGVHFDIIILLLSISLVIPSINIATRRLHDINRSGWNQLYSLIPLVGWIYVVYLLANKSDEFKNQYGEESVE